MGTYTTSISLPIYFCQKQVRLTEYIYKTAVPFTLIGKFKTVPMKEVLSLLVTKAAK